MAEALERSRGGEALFGPGTHPTMGFFNRGGSEEDPEVAAARVEAEAALSAGWELCGCDREHFYVDGIGFEAWAAAARGPEGAVELAVATTQASSYRALADRLKGDLPHADAWAPRPGRAEVD